MAAISKFKDVQTIKNVTPTKKQMIGKIILVVYSYRRLVIDKLGVRVLVVVAQDFETKLFKERSN